MIVFDNVTYEYGSSNIALNGFSLQVAKGEFVAVIGHNGSGKSTFAKHINALYVPTQGDVTTAGMNTRQPDDTLRIRAHVGMVFQNPDNQMVTAVVEDDVAFGPENLGVRQDELRARVDDALKSVRMGRYAKSMVHTLSGGQKQRVAIAGILAMRPEIIVFDEPTAMLDPMGRKEVIDAIVRLHGEHITIVLITHFMEEAALAERIVVMNDGQIALSGTPQQVFRQSDRLVALGLDAPFSVRFCEEAQRNGLSLPLCCDEEGLVNEICRLCLKT